ncbi:MAG: nuclear transport factor 2 family protein [Alphaproteobacteria bacterium]
MSFSSTIPTSGYSPNLQRWMDYLLGDHDKDELYDMLDPDAVFFSPVVFRGQEGRDLTFAYLTAAGQTLNDDFKYVNVFDCGDQAILEFEVNVDGMYVNGIDMIFWNDAGKITKFKVMLRPMKALEVTRQNMAKALAAMNDAG